MLHTPLKHAAAGHAPAQHPLSTTRCSPHNAQPHELNFTDWIHMSPAQVALMSPATVAQSPAVHYTPPTQFYGPHPNPLQYSARNDFMTTSPLPYSPPFAHPYSVAPTPNSNFSLQVPIISVEDTQHTPQFPSQRPSSSLSSGPLPRSFADYLSYSSEANANSVSPVSRHADAESTPVTTLSGEDVSQGQVVAEDTQQRPLLELLRAASPDTNSSNSSSNLTPAPSKEQPKPTESTESPFRIVQPQPRTFTPLHSSPLSELAEVASRQPTPSQAGSRPASRPSSALSTHSSKSQKVQRRLPLVPHRFEPSPLQVRLPHLISSLTPSITDTLIESQRGPLEFGEEGHRYRTRSKLRNLKAEIQEKERQSDLALIRKALKGANEDASSLQLLASVSASRCVEMEVEDSPVSKPPAKLKRGAKRSFRDFDAESTASSSNESKRSPSKRPRVEKQPAAKKQDEHVPMTRTRAAASRIVAISQPLARTKEKELAARQSASARRSTRQSKTISKPVDTDEASSLTSMSDAEYDSEPKEPRKKTMRKAKATPRPAEKSSEKPSPIASPKLLTVDDTPIDIPTRTFPSNVPMHAAFSQLYRKFPLSGYMDPQGIHSVPPPGALPGGHFNAPRSAEDLYTPRFVRGVGRDKAGLCPICYESKERGGAGKADWLSMKFSAFNYHMQYAHGISPTTTLPFSPPIAFRTLTRKPNHKNEKTELLEGQCHRCHEWTAVEGVKCVEAKLKEIYWWKHAAQCHKGSTIEGERDVHIEDDMSRQVITAFKLQAAAYKTQQQPGPSSRTKSESASPTAKPVFAMTIVP